ncbi:MAG: CBS domain-containing protein [Pirellulales bacterium]|jgi:CBS domain-containing protein
MTLHDILRAKGPEIQTISPDATLDDVARKLVQHNIGSLVVCAPGGDPKTRPFLGIITERDLLRACAAKRAPLDQIKVSEVMSTRVITGSPSDAVEQILGIMTKNRVRHLPVLEAGQLKGIVSMGDVVKAHLEQLAIENQCLRQYIHG